MRLHESVVDQLSAPITRTVAILANVAWVLIVALAVGLRDTGLALTAWPGVVVAAIAMAQLLSGRTDVRILLIACAITLLLAGVTIGDSRATWPIVASLAATGIALSLYIPQHPVAYISGYSSALILVIMRADREFIPNAITAATTAIVYSFTIYLVRLLTLQSRRETERFRSLFYHSPVAMWEEDFTGVARFLRGLRDSGELDLEEYLRSQPDAVLRIAGLIEITAANDAAVDLLEAESCDSMLGQLRNRDIETVDALTDQLLAVWHGADHIVTEVPRAKTMRGRELHLALSWTAPLVDGRPDYRHVAVAAVDVTESRAAREALEALVRSKDELVATVSHELRTPLTTVVGLASELDDSIDAFAPEELRELVSLIASEGREVSTIVEDLLAAAQAETGQLQLNPVRVDLVELAGDVHRTLPHHADVALYVPDGPVWALADAVRTRQIVRNLVVNAERYGGSQVRICVPAAASTASLEVRDSGKPLPFKEREAIFDRFYRTRQVPGLTASVGLGLTVSRQLARDMGGDLTYSHDGEEAIFELVLPTYLAEPQELATRREAAG